LENCKFAGIKIYYYWKFYIVSMLHKNIIHNLFRNISGICTVVLISTKVMSHEPERSIYSSLKSRIMS